MGNELSHASSGFSRRMFMLAVSGAPIGLCLLPDLVGSTPLIAPDDPKISTETVTVDNGAGGLLCYSAQPAKPVGALASIIVAHDALGLTPHFEDVARRLAAQGSFAVLAPDYASRYGGTPSEPTPAREVVGMTSWDEWLADSRSAFTWLTQQKQSNGKVAALGFGLGGSALSRMVFQMSELMGAVVFYGRVPPLQSVLKVNARLLLNYAADDPLVNPGVPEFEQALEKAGVDYQAFVYEGARHGFEDDTAHATYSQDAGKLAWSRTMEFLKQTTA